MSKSKLEKATKASKKKVEKAVKKPVKTAKKVKKAAVKTVASAKKEVLKSVPVVKKENSTLYKVTVFLLGMVAGALLFLFLSSYSAGYGQTNSLNKFFDVFKPTVNTVQTQNLNLTNTQNLKDVQNLNTNTLLKPNVDGD